MIPCQISYDHNEDLDKCEVCGWPNNQEKPQSSLDNIPKWLWPENTFVPNLPVTLCGGGV